jgi:ABC-2 type transport system ATP-binding protein
VKPGSIFGFLGPNGAGKTTSLRMLLGIIEPGAGDIRVLGNASVMGVRERVGYLPEERGLYRRMTPVEVIVYMARLKGMDAAPARKEALRLLEQFGLGAFANAKIETLSKGMAQKVQILGTVVHGPDLVILDEPFSGLDPVNQQVLEGLIADLHNQGRTLIFSTHVMQHAERLCDRLLLIARGRKVFEGSLMEARALMSRTVRVKTTADSAQLAALPGITSVSASAHHDGTFDLSLAAGASSEDVLRACFERALALTGFDTSEPSLHDIFVTLVGTDAATADARRAS